MPPSSAVIIGSGIGGLATAIRLACKGYTVTVLERQSKPGGKLSVAEWNGFRFDLGPSLFTEPDNLRALFQLAGVSMEEYLPYRRVHESCRYHFPNGKVFCTSDGPKAFARELGRIADEDVAGVERYLYRAAAAYDTLGKVFLSYSLHRWSTWLHPRILKAIRHTRLDYLTKSLHGYNQSQFRTEEARLIFDRFATYNGSDPYRTPAMLSMIPHLEINQGTWYPEGGMGAIAQSLYGLACALGVQFRFDAAVDQIVCEQGRVTGVKVKDAFVPAKVVVSNVDVVFTYRDLLRDLEQAKYWERQERSSSGVIFYWGMRKTFPALRLHNIFFSGTYRDEFRNIFSGEAPVDDPTIYVNITSKMESGHAPEGKENWFVMVNVPAGLQTEDKNTVDRLRQHVVQKLERMLGESVAEHIELERVQTPKGIEEDTGSYMGALYGTSSNSKFSAFLRHPNASRRVKGLYFVGGSVHPGGGLPLCLKGAAIVAGLVPEP